MPIDATLPYDDQNVFAKILRGERELSKAHLRKLAERFKVDAGLFL